MEYIATYFFLILGMVLLMKAYNKSCIKGHNFVDKGKYFVCTKCRALMVKNIRR